MTKKTLQRGYFQVYTGEGKGKTTAALGLAFRAAGSGLRTYIGQFMKGVHYGELTAAKQLAPAIVIEQYGRPAFVHPQQATEEDINLAKTGLAKLKKAVLNGEYDIVIMDEVNVALYFKLISVDEVLEIIDQKPEQVEIIATGRYAPQALIDRADLVTEMRQIKHYYTQGVKARKGIEK
ncbi:cob(I)yrinic acid a,c-diamide adenosyltransferase [candidate division KSB1 bacterium]|nr:MAG: cob(I)yrinic acid a,c-diamide adenosyltransferase [candidate division KSB1 bacterium]RKY88659.1 MAG: cob(I)yrinic acid a,c-diamide adenosyltransferase [candidate division KSB1 bacterium]RKY92781.1 MAG: cob(I)yrinic acid a,c-diamide adenosyltransferase [candidate division KSB1 bacterium]